MPPLVNFGGSLSAKLMKLQAHNPGKQEAIRTRLNLFQYNIIFISLQEQIITMPIGTW